MDRNEDSVDGMCADDEDNPEDEGGDEREGDIRDEKERSRPHRRRRRA